MGTTWVSVRVTLLVQCPKRQTSPDIEADESASPSPRKWFKDAYVSDYFLGYLFPDIDIP